jgi:hypothetical protein
METRRSVPGLIATVLVAGVIAAGAAAVTPDTYHDMNNPTATTSAVAAGSATTSTSCPDTYHDMC